MNLADGSWLDRMYNNRELVPDHGRWFERWAALSAQAVDGPRVQLDLPYGSAPKQRLDIFEAPQAGAPVLVFIHGGYWRALDKADHSFVAPPFNAAGACVVIPNYTLCPETDIAGITLEMVRALEWTWRNVARHGGDPSRIVVAGHSAGGHLAAMMLACLWHMHAADLPVDLVKAALSISGLHDLEPIMHTPFLQPSLRLTPAQVAQASPARLPSPAAGVMAAVAGAAESDEFPRQALLLQQAWGAARVPVCETLPGLNHFSILDALVDPGHRLHRIAIGLLSQ